MKQAWILILTSVACFGQSAVAPITPQEFGYFKFLLTTLGGPLATQDSVTRQENLLRLQFDLNDAELAIIDSARSQVRTILAQAQQATMEVTAGKVLLASGDVATLAAIDSQMGQQLSAMAYGILVAVRPATAARLRMPGNIVANGFAAGIKTNTGVK